MIENKARQELRRPLNTLEEKIVRIAMSNPSSVSEEALSWLRYIVSFARLTTVRNSAGEDIELRENLSRFRWLVLHELLPLVQRKNPVPALLASLPKLTAETQRERIKILEHTKLDAKALEEEVCQRQLVIVSGGGGGCGYGYAGVFQTLHRAGLQPKLLAGTSIGSLISVFRARADIFDQLPMYEAVRRLKWSKVFRILEVSNRYGVPATLRLYLRDALDSMFVTKDGRSVTFNDCEIPFLICATGLTVDAFKHDLSYYEHFMDDAVRQGQRFRPGTVRRIIRMTSILYEFFSNPEAMREIIFGADDLTREADVLDAAGFSSAVPGLIHYDVLRDDPRMTHLLDKMYGEFGITRLTEGGLVNNIPVRPAFQEVMKGRITRRNPFILALDCFSPQMTSMWYPIQQLVLPNVKENIFYANHYFSLKRRLPALNVVPTISQATKSIEWTSKEFSSHLPFVTRMCLTHQDLPFESIKQVGLT